MYIQLLKEAKPSVRDTKYGAEHPSWDTPPMPSSSSTSPSEGDDMAVTAEASDKGSDSEIDGGSEEAEDEERDYDDGEERAVDLSDSLTVSGDGLNVNKRVGANVALSSEASSIHWTYDGNSITAASNSGEDSSQEIKSEGHDEDLRSGSSTPEKSKPTLPADICDIEGIGASPNKKVLCDVPRFYNEAYAGTEAHLSKSDPLGACNTISLADKEKLVAAETLMSNGSSKKDSNGVLNTGDDTKRMDIKEGEDLKLRVSSLLTSQLRTRSLSPGAEFEDRNKRPAIVCDFFARGWCVKGSSCRFLHLKDGTGKGDVPIASWENEVKVDAGLRQNTDASKFPDFPEPLASSVANGYSAKSHFPSERFLPREHGENLGWHQFPEEHRLSSVQRGCPSSGIIQGASGSNSLPHHDFQKFSTRDDLGQSSSFGGVGRENPRQNSCADEFSKHASPVVQGDFPKFDTLSRGWPANRSESWTNSIREDHSQIPLSALTDNKLSVAEEFIRGSPLARGSLGHGYRYLSSGSIISSSMYKGSGDPSVYDGSVKEPPSLKQKNRSMIYDHTLSVFSSSTSLPSIGMSPSSSYISSSFNGLDGDHGYHASHSASLPRNSSSPFYSRSEPDQLPLHSVPKDLSSSAGHKLQSSSNDWEPSKPFRPSFFFDPASISSPGSQYDPLLDSIEPHSGGHKSFHVSSLSQGAGIQHMSYQRTNYDSGLTLSHEPEYNTDKNSFYFNQQSHSRIMEKNIHSHGLHMAADETFGSSVADAQTKVSTPREGKIEKPGHGHVLDVANTKLISHDSNPRNQTDARHKKESKSGGGRHNDERQKQDLDVQNQESKALKLFRTALVDFVKELVKPSWREGHLRKDAHKAIVKKAVDKVISTLQPHQVPSTTELIIQYLSSSRSKIAKLVEGYVDKYAKSSAAIG